MQVLWEKVKLILGLVDFSAIIDIIIVAFIIYKVIIFLRDSRAQLFLKGIFAIFIAYLLALLLDLQMVSYIIDLIVKNGAIAIIVILHPELRQALEKMGRSGATIKSRLFRNEDAEQRAELLNAITNVVESFRHLQIERMGALVVFEQKVLLDEIVRTGTMVDARAEVPVISNIFFKNAPLHDGAMIIRNGRVCAAGCILPLTEKTNISVSVGTRHRAAIGMSENSDAVVVVLSEETGHLSVAVDGVLRSYETAAELSNQLVRLLVPERLEDEENGEHESLLNGLRNMFLPLIDRIDDDDE